MYRMANPSSVFASCQMPPPSPDKFQDARTKLARCALDVVKKCFPYNKQEILVKIETRKL